MKKIIFLFCLVVSMLFNTASYSQVCTDFENYDPNTNTDSELSGYQVTFEAINLSEFELCEIIDNSANFAQLNVASIPLNNFHTPFSIVSNDNEPSLISLPVAIPTTSTNGTGSNSNYAIKLNGSNGSLINNTLNTTMLSRSFTAIDQTLSFDYSYIVVDWQGQHDEFDINGVHQPITIGYFKVEIINPNDPFNNIEFCLNPEEQPGDFTMSSNGALEFFYTNWNTENYTLPSSWIGEDITINFYVSNCGLSGDHFSTVYLDNICLPRNVEDIGNIIELDDTSVNCPTEPIDFCGSFMIPNGTTVNEITLDIIDDNNNTIINPTAPTIDFSNNTFCFTIDPTILAPYTEGPYELQANITFNNGDTAFDLSSSPHADISFKLCDELPCLNAGTGGSIPFCSSDNTEYDLFNYLNDASSGGAWSSTNPGYDNDGFYNPSTESIHTTFSYTIPATDDCPESVATITIELTTESIPVFGTFEPICIDSNPTLPTQDINGITGTWNPSLVTNTVSTNTYTFTPNEDCMSELSVDIETIDCTLDCPSAGTYDAVTLCTNDNTNYDLFNFLIGADPGGFWTNGDQNYNNGSIYNPSLNSDYTTIFYTIPASEGCPRSFVILNIELETCDPCDFNAEIVGNSLVWNNITTGNYYIEFIGSNDCPNMAGGLTQVFSYTQQINNISLLDIQNDLDVKCFRWRIRTDECDWTDWCLIGADPNSTTGFFVAYDDCLSTLPITCDPIVLTSPTDDIGTGSTVDHTNHTTIHASNIIETSATSNYAAEDTIVLLPGFHAQYGSNFHAYIDPCDTSVGRFEEDKKSSKTNDEYEDLQIDALKIYPNPTENELNLIANGNKISQFELYNIQGQLILSDLNLSTSEQIINLQDYDSGIYILKVTLDNEDTITNRIVKK